MTGLIARATSHSADYLQKLRRQRTFWPVLLLSGYILLAYYRFEMTTGAFRNSDDSGNFLAGVELAEGNWRLAGWVMATDNYYPTDVFGQALLRAIFGFHPIFMQLWEGLVWAGVALVGTWLACVDRPIRQKPGIACTALAMLAFNIFDHRFEDNFMSCVASHGCTILLTITAFSIVGRKPQRGMLPLSALGIVVTAGCFSDPIFNVIACLPILAEAGLSLDSQRRSVPRLAVTATGMLAARLLLACLERIGGFQSVGLSVPLASFPEFLMHVSFLAESIPRLLGANFFARSFEQNLTAGPIIQLMRLPLVILFIGAVCETGSAVIRRVRVWPAKTTDHVQANIDQLLWFSVILCVASACMTTVIYEQSGARFFIPAAVSGSVLAARRLGRLRLVALYGGLILPASVAMGVAALPPQQTPRSTMVLPQFKQIAAVLGEHGLVHGYAGYWEGTIITVLTQRKVTSLPLIPSLDGHLHAFRTLTNLDWYANAARDWRGRVFFISASHPEGAELSDRDGREQFGAPRERYNLGQFVIEVFDTSDPQYMAPTA